LTRFTHLLAVVGQVAFTGATEAALVQKREVLQRGLASAINNAAVPANSSSASASAVPATVAVAVTVTVTVTRIGSQTAPFGDDAILTRRFLVTAPSNTDTPGDGDGGGSGGGTDASPPPSATNAAVEVSYEATPFYAIDNGNFDKAAMEVSEVKAASSLAAQIRSVTKATLTKSISDEAAALGLVNFDPAAATTLTAEEDWLEATDAPTALPSTAPTPTPTPSPTTSPTGAPTGAPTSAPTGAPSVQPTGSPTPAPTPSTCADRAHNGNESDVDCGGSPFSGCRGCGAGLKCLQHTDCVSGTCLTGTMECDTPAPTEAPTAAPTAVPTAAPTPTPTASPSAVPTERPTPLPTAVPTPDPTGAPSVQPTGSPTPAPTPSDTERYILKRATLCATY
jgi:hypothetical protein